MPEGLPAWVALAGIIFAVAAILGIVDRRRLRERIERIADEMHERDEEPPGP
jgi:hypothetical protein